MAECNGECNGDGGPGNLIREWRYHRDAIIKSCFAEGRGVVEAQCVCETRKPGFEVTDSLG